MASGASAKLVPLAIYSKDASLPCVQVLRHEDVDVGDHMKSFTLYTCWRLQEHAQARSHGPESSFDG